MTRNQHLLISIIIVAVLFIRKLILLSIPVIILAVLFLTFYLVMLGLSWL